MLLFFFIFLLLTSPVSADGFDQIYNSSFNSYKQTTGLSYSYLPVSKSPFELGMSYDTSLVKGVATEDVWGNYPLEYLTGNNYWERKSNLLSEVNGPPGTHVDLLYYYFNKTGHSIEVYGILLPFSRGDSSLGNWMNVIMGVTGVTYRDIPISWEQLVLSRKGLMKEYVGPGQMDNGEGGSSIIDSFVIKDPINIEKIEMLPEGQEIKGKIVLRNFKNTDLENINISHGSFSSTYTIPAMDTIEIEYSLDSDDWGDILTISNPNFARECILYGNALSDWITTDAITSLAFREDGDGVNWVNGSYLKPEGEDFCITQIPYSTNIPLRKPQLEEEEEEDIEEGNEEDSEETIDDEPIVPIDSQDPDSDDLDQEDPGEEGEVLGIQVSPDEDSVNNEDSVNYEDPNKNKDNNFVLPKTAVVIY
jgi:hypothetical protein